MDSESIKIAVDLDGGDHAPKVVTKGIFLAIKKGWALPQQIVVLGSSESISKFRQKDTFGITCQECSQTIAMGDDLNQIRKKRRSSIALGVYGVKTENFNAFVSAGETKAMVIWGKMLLAPKTEGLDLRPAIGVKMPHLNGLWLLVDAGANLEARSVINLVHNAQMGAIYAQEVMGIENPKIGLINIGQESSKGDQILKDAHTLLAQSPLNFIGNVEARDLFFGKVDVAVCEGWDGNLILKTGEGIIEMLKIIGKKEFKRLFSKPTFPSFTRRLLAYISMPAVWLLIVMAMPLLYITYQEIKRKISYEEVGGAALLGTPGMVICHGRSNAKAIANAIKFAAQESQSQVHNLITTTLTKTQ